MSAMTDPTDKYPTYQQCGFEYTERVLVEGKNTYF